MNKLQLSILFLTLLVIGGCNNNEKEKKEIATAQNDSEDWALIPFIKVDSLNPILGPGTGEFNCPVIRRKIKWENKDVFNPAAIVKDGKVFMLYRAEDTIGKYAGTSRIGLAESNDGLHFVRHPEPVFFPDNDAQKKYEWEGGCEDPRLVQGEGGTYILTYTAYDGDKARLMIASSKDLKKWTKHGHAFANSYNGKYVDNWSKSGSIVSRYTDDGNIVATKINNKYWMYWGDVNIWAAVSDDLIHWSPILYNEGEKPGIELRHNSVEIPEVKIVFGPRKGKFDSDLVEPGPPAMITDKGIVLIYNSRNVPSIGDSSLAEGTYAASQILLDKNDPTKVVSRMDGYFMKPDKNYEISGQVNHVCFVEGLVNFKDRWFLYYGTADSKIAAAIK
ncbi:MAG TPA: glycoside hydrolase family 130 protein [Flavitalea sp.]|nr:glycoside hydrolase family 130 protein [Flavitalea sp.]